MSKKTLSLITMAFCMTGCIHDMDTYVIYQKPQTINKVVQKAP